MRKTVGLAASSAPADPPASEASTASGRGRASRIMRLPAVKARVGAGRSTIYDWIAKGLFPRPVALGPRMVGWREDDIDDWLAARRPRGEA